MHHLPVPQQNTRPEPALTVLARLSGVCGLRGKSCAALRAVATFPWSSPVFLMKEE